MMVAETLRRNRKMTSTTRPTVSQSVNFTSFTESRTDAERSNRMFRLTEGGIWARKLGSSFLMASTTSTVLVPGCRWMASTIDRASLNQLAALSFCTLSITSAQVLQAHRRAVAPGHDQGAIGRRRS